MSGMSAEDQHPAMTKKRRIESSIPVEKEESIHMEFQSMTVGAYKMMISLCLGETKMLPGIQELVAEYCTNSRQQETAQYIASSIYLGKYPGWEDPTDTTIYKDAKELIEEAKQHWTDVKSRLQEEHDDPEQEEWWSEDPADGFTEQNMMEWLPNLFRMWEHCTPEDQEYRWVSICFGTVISE